VAAFTGSFNDFLFGHHCLPISHLVLEL